MPDEILPDEEEGQNQGPEPSIIDEPSESKSGEYSPEEMAIMVNAFGYIPNADEPRAEVKCPFCKHEFRFLYNAESLSMIRCPKCGRWFPVHINLGEDPLEMMSMDEFEAELKKNQPDEGELEDGEGLLPEPTEGPGENYKNKKKPKK